MISGRTLASRFEHNASVRYRVNMFIELHVVMISYQMFRNCLFTTTPPLAIGLC